MLGIDTATPVTSLAIGSEAGTLAAVTIRQERGHAEVLAPAVEWMLARAGNPGPIGGVAVGLGPGLFTGLRVGISSAKAFAHAWGVPVVGVPSLDLLAFAQRHARQTVCAAIDARRGELFAAFYRQAPGGVLRIGEFQVLRPAALAAEVAARRERVLLVGEGALAHPEEFGRLGELVTLAAPAQSFPSAEALVELALPRFHREDFTSPFGIAPLYLRRPDADPARAWSTAVARSPG